MSDEPESQEPGEAARQAGDEVAASLVEEYRSLTRAFITDPANAIPLEIDEPVPGGIRPGPETGHKPSAEAGSEDSPSQPSSPRQSE